MLERQSADIVGMNSCVAMNSCSSAFCLSLLTSGVKPGDKVLMPAVTEDYVIDPDDLEKKLTPATTVLLLSCMRGRVPDLGRILEICKRYGITLVDDDAHAQGVRWDGDSVFGFQWSDEQPIGSRSDSTA